MTGRIEGRDSQWRTLLLRCHGAVEVDDSFRAGLLGKLKARQAEVVSEAKERDVGREEQWSRFLGTAYPACAARRDFRMGLLAELKSRQTASRSSETSQEASGEAPIRNLLSNAYSPVKPRQEFQTRLLMNLKERQKTSAETRANYRRRSIFSSFVSSLAAAAVLFVVWLVPGGDSRTGESAPSGIGAAHSGGQTPDIPSDPPLAQSPADDVPSAVASAPDAEFPYAYDVNELFASPSLPKSVRGVGMEINDGDGWRRMDESTVTRVSPGMAFRSTRKTAGLGFNDGSTVLMWPDSVVTATPEGFMVDQGQLAVTVPAGSEDRFRLRLPERDIAIESGTMLAVNAFFPGLYARGGAPAPEVKVLDGGLAVARGKNGDAPLLANQVYLMDAYVTPDIPGRPLCAAEYDELNDVYRTPSALAGLDAHAYAPARLVSAPVAEQSAARGPHGFTKNGRKWIANSYDGRPATRIKYLSNEYFALANARRDLAPALAAGPEAIIDAGGGIFYEMHR